jgi:hypothetical protein
MVELSTAMTWDSHSSTQTKLGGTVVVPEIASWQTGGSRGCGSTAESDTIECWAALLRD